MRDVQGADQLISHLWLTHPLIYRLDLNCEGVSCSVYSNLREIILDVGNMRQDEVTQIARPDILISFLHDPRVARPSVTRPYHLTEGCQANAQEITVEYHDGMLEFDRQTKCTTLLTKNRVALLGDLAGARTLFNNFIDRVTKRYIGQHSQWA